MMRMWRLIALAVLLLGVTGVLRLYWGGFVWKSGLSNDAIVVLFVGLIAFLAVMIQIEEDRIRRFEDQERENKALATAILFEIDSIYRGFVREVEALFKKVGPDANFERDLMAKRIEKFPFAVYEGCAPLLGRLLPQMVEGIVHLYGGVAIYLMNLNELYAAVERAQSASCGDHRRTEVDHWVQQVRNQVEPLRILAAEVSERLCEFAEIPKSRMAVLADTQELHAQTH